MTVQRFGKKLLKIAAYVLGSILILLTVFHFWFVNHAKGMLEDFVENKTHGKLKLKIEKLSFGYFSNRMKIKKAVFFTTDSSTAPASYRFAVKEIRLQLKALWPLVFKNRLLIDSLHLQSADIQVTNLRYPPGDSIKKNKKDISIPRAMGKVYNSIQDALKLLQVNRFQIDDGKFTLINKIQPGELPLIVGNINFHIDNLQVDTSKLSGKEKLFFSDNVVLKSNKQNISFPDGRHRLSFDRFRINIRKRLVEFDSCTISAIKTDSTKTSFSIFFDKLLLSNIDFDTLYKNEVIKADTVFCLNPQFKLQTEIKNKKGSAGKSPKLEAIIQQLTGDLLLGYVIVNNASFDITTLKNGYPNSFTSQENNFEMQGLSIDHDAKKLIKVKSFAMAIRNYENFIRDSSYSVQFDSILFKDNHISLSNFLFHKLDKGKIINTFNIPDFYLGGLSWDDLVFEKKLIAEQALMFNPSITYTVSHRPGGKKGKQNIFQSLAAINNYLDLQNLDIVDGMIDLKIKEDLKVKLEKATLSIRSHSLLTSTKMAGIKNSLTKLNFDNGVIQAGNLSMELHDLRYFNPTGQFGAGNISIIDKEKNMYLSLQDVSIEKLQVDEQTGNINAEGVKWQQGDLKLNIAANKNGSPGSSLELKHVEGHHTSIAGTFGGKLVSAKLNNLVFASLEKKAGHTLKVDSLSVDGTQLKVKDNNLILSVADYQVADNKNSSFGQITFRSGNGKTTADVSIPLVTLTPHVQPLINGEIALDDINMAKPVINIHGVKRVTAGEEKSPGLPKIDISEIKMTQPEINFTQAADSGETSFSWHGEKQSSNFLQLNNLHNKAGVTDLSIHDLRFFLTDFAFANPKGKTFNTGNGKIAARIRDVGIEQKINQPVDWNAVVTGIDAADFRFDSIGKAGGNFMLNSAKLKELHISSTTINNLQKLFATNRSFQVSQFYGQYADMDKSFLWYNGSFNRSNNTFSLDSFIFRQALDKDSFNAKQKFQSDYINAKTGAIRMNSIDIDDYLRDSTLKIGIVNIDNTFFTDYKDKRLPFNTGIIKPLPVNLIKKIPLQLSVDSVVLNNAHVEYSETGEKLKKTGTIGVTRMNIIFSNVKNYGFSNKDSLRLLAIGYLMDSIWTRLRVKESYTDSAGGFLMTLRMKPADLKVLNAALIPLSSMKLVSAYLDTLSMRAVGREYLSLGEMKMFYHNLKIRILTEGDETKKSFRNSLINFMANSIIIRKKNTSRTGQVFFIRNRERSAINYLIQIAMSGMTSSIGAKSNRKMMRTYKKELIERNLPPIDFD